MPSISKCCLFWYHVLPMSLFWFVIKSVCVCQKLEISEKNVSLKQHDSFLLIATVALIFPQSTPLENLPSQNVSHAPFLPPCRCPQRASPPRWASTWTTSWWASPGRTSWTWLSTRWSAECSFLYVQIFPGQNCAPRPSPYPRKPRGIYIYIYLFIFIYIYVWKLHNKVACCEKIWKEQSWKRRKKMTVKRRGRRGRLIFEAAAVSRRLYW